MKAFLSFVFLLLSTLSFSQNHQNLQKYWVYRERLKNFVVSADCQGCGIPANWRGRNLETNQYEPMTTNYDDAPWMLRCGIVTLAMEYHLLKRLQSR